MGYGRTALLQTPDGEEGQEEEEEGTQWRAVGSGGEARRGGRPSTTGATGREETGICERRRDSPPRALTGSGRRLRDAGTAETPPHTHSSDRGLAAPVRPIPTLTRCLRLSRRGAGSSPCWGAGTAGPYATIQAAAGSPGPARRGLTASAAEGRRAPCSRLSAPPSERMRRPPPPRDAASAAVRPRRSAGRHLGSGRRAEEGGCAGGPGPLLRVLGAGGEACQSPGVSTGL